jgi:hypothetical protein
MPSQSLKHVSASGEAKIDSIQQSTPKRREPGNSLVPKHRQRLRTPKDSVPQPRYRLTEKILSVQVTADQSPKELLYVPAGAVISIGEEDLSPGDLVAVQWDSQTVLMFRQDIDSRTEHFAEPLHYTAAMGSVCAVR